MDLRPSTSCRVRRVLLLAGFCLLVFGAKLWFIRVAGSDLPSWDQWDAEGEVVLRPWVEGWMGLKEILHPHNEHRLITTKLYVLGLFVANGQWDGFLETTVNAAIHTAAALVLLLGVARWLSRPWPLVAGGLLALLFGLPFAWENTLFGFQVQFYFLLLFSLGHVWLTVEGDRFSGRWFLGQLCGVLALCSLASGFLSSVAVLAVLGHRLVRERRWTAQQIVTAVLAIGLSIAGWFMKNEVPAHAFLHAHSPAQFGVGVLKLLAWPGSALFPWTLLLAGPTVLFVARRLTRRATTPDEAILMGLLAWVLLQCFATAFARGGAETVLSPRYLDLLAVNVILGLVFLVRETAGRTRVVLASAWLAVVAGGLWQQSRMMWDDFVAANIPRQQVQEMHVRDFVRTGDPAHLLNKPWGDVPYPDGPTLVQRLSFASIRAILPPSVRRSFPLANGAPTAVPAEVAPADRPVALSTWLVPLGPGGYSWRSAPQPATALPILRFRVAGGLGAPDNPGRLVVRSAAGAVPVIPEEPAGDSWKTVNVIRPPGEWWVEASTPQPSAWFAFTEPVDVGYGSWAAEKLLKHHALFTGLGALLIAAGLLLERRRAG
ncbi:MAG: hypothetical protein JSR48_10805 [Verrucomicrobia bacterium]|nr:hypothetical protein [Verrucomicrobiota bacterium]